MFTRHTQLQNDLPAINAKKRMMISAPRSDSMRRTVVQQKSVVRQKDRSAAAHPELLMSRGYPSAICHPSRLPTAKRSIMDIWLILRDKRNLYSLNGGMSQVSLIQVIERRLLGTWRNRGGIFRDTRHSFLVSAFPSSDVPVDDSPMTADGATQRSPPSSYAGPLAHTAQ